MLHFFRLIIVYFIVFSAFGSFAAPGIISFTSNKILDFGSVTKQTGVDVTAVVSNTSNNRGEIIIKDGNSSTETINVTFQSCGLTADKVRVKDFTVKYGTQSWNVSGDGPFTQTNLPNPANSGTKLQYGATALVTKDAKIGSLSPCYNISIQYDCASSNPPCTNASAVVDNDFANLLVLGAPVVINQIQQMSFGPITKPTSNSTVILQPNGAMSVASGNAILLNGNAGLPSEFEIIAEKNVPISIYATRGAAVRGLRLNNLTASFNNGSVQNINNSGNAKVFNSSASGSNNLKIGATLEMTANNTRFGHYNVSYDITIDYQ